MHPTQTPCPRCGSKLNAYENKLVCLMCGYEGQKGVVQAGAAPTVTGEGKKPNPANTGVPGHQAAVLKPPTAGTADPPKPAGAQAAGAGELHYRFHVGTQDESHLN